MTTEQLAALKEVAEKAQQQAPEQRILMRYEHGGGRMYVERDDPDNDLRPHRDLVADFYDEASREHYAAFDPTTCLELLGEVERLREVERESQALDRLTDRVLKFDITEALKP
jgi:hypothetical protein